MQQTAVETEAREKTIKAQNEEIQERLKIMDEKGGRSIFFSKHSTK